jgi:hypothetical protein
MVGPVGFEPTIALLNLRFTVCLLEPLAYSPMSHQILVGAAGFEPAVVPFETPDLQSGGLNHSPTRPCGRIREH